jgi:hypothetical protein
MAGKRNPSRRSMAIYIRPPRKTKKRRKKKKKSNPPARRRKTTKKARRRYRRTNPAPVRYRTRTRTVTKYRTRRANQEEVRRFTDIIKPVVAAVGGYMVPGIVWKLIGSGNRAKMIGWFAENGDAKARMTIAGVSTVGLYLLTSQFNLGRKYQRSIMIGSGLRLAKETADAFLSMKPGTTSDTVRMIMGLPTASTLGRAFVGQSWPTQAPLPPGTKRNPTTGKLEPASYEPEEYPGAQYDPYGQYYGQQYGQQYGAQPPAQPYGPGTVQAGFQNGGQMPYNGNGGQMPPGYNGEPPIGDLMGYSYRNMAGYAQRQPANVAGYAQRQPANMAGWFPRPF